MAENQRLRERLGQVEPRIAELERLLEEVRRAARVSDIPAIAADQTNLYLADTLHHRVRMVDPSGTITTFAGNLFIGGGETRCAGSTPPESSPPWPATGRRLSTETDCVVC